MAITAKQVQDLREKTGLSMMAIKKALEETGGDEEKALLLMREKGILKAQEKSTRAVSQGVIATYVHQTKKLASMVTLLCETDFVARNEEFVKAANEIAMHVAAIGPEYLSPEQVPADVLEKEKDIFRAQLKEEGKPEKIWDNILEGKVKKLYEERCLLQQKFLLNDEQTVEQVVVGLVSKLGENIKIGEFIRWQL